MEKDKEATSLKKNFFRLLLLTTAGATIYTLPYFRSYFYDAYMAMYSLTNVQMGSLGSAYGLLGLLSYLLGGVLADGVSARKLLSLSLVLTGLGGFAHLMTRSYIVLLVIYGMWGITSLLTFWPALIKAIRMLASNDEQGRAFGIFEGVRGIVNAIVYPLGLAIFGLITKTASDIAGLNGVIICYSSITLVCGIGVFFSIADTEKVERKKFEMQNLIRIAKMPAVWLICFILFMTYSFNMSFYYFTPYATQVFGSSAVFAAAITMLAQYCRPVAAISAGFLGNKIGNAHVRLVSMALMALGTIAILLIPGHMSMMPLFITACVVIYVAMYANYGLVFAMLQEGHVPMEVSGIAIGLVSTLGYLPEVLAPLVAGTLLDKYPGAQGYQYFFTILTVCAVLGVIGIFVWKKKYYKKPVADQKAV
ncbi:MAG: MFS transporter [Clostridiales bacterium]|nr:MFS transporter [Clostridiales bacterium]